MRWTQLRRRLHSRLGKQLGVYASTDNDRGSILLVAVGILMLLSVMATAFVANMTLERKATRNYVDSVKARLIAEAGLARAIEEQRTRIFASGYSDTNNIYANGDFWLPLQVTRDYINASLPNDPFRASIVGTMGQSYTNGVDRYKIKIVDTQSQFNLNTRFAGGDDSHELMYTTVLRTLGAAIAESVPRMNQRITQAARDKGLDEFQDLLFPAGNPFDRAAWPRNTDSNGNPNQGATRRGVPAIIALLKSKPNQRFQSKAELLECMDEADYRVIRDFVTANSFLDPKSVSANAEIGAVKVLRDGGAIPPPTNIANDTNASAGSAGVTLRAPININLAPQEVIQAMLAPIAGQRVFIHTGKFTDSAYEQTDLGTDFSGNINKRTLAELVYQPNNSYTNDPNVPEAAYGTRKFLVAFKPIGLTVGPGNIVFKQLCKDIVTKIIERRSNDSLGGAFKSFMDWDRFVEEKIWPLVASIDPISSPDHQPEIYEVNNGQVRLVSNTLANEIMNNHDFKHWFRRSFIGMLKSAMNPNDRYSQFNPDQAVFTEIDKGSLVTFSSNYESNVSSQTGQNQADRRPQVAQTCEWCFSTKGVFELVALGEIATNATQELLQAYNFPANSARVGTGTKRFAADIHAQVKLRSVLRIFGEITHTSQQDFARNGHAGSGREPGNVNVVGFPIVDEERVYAGAPIFRRANMRSFPIDEKYWWNVGVDNSNTSINPYLPNEVAGLKGNASLFSSAGAGYIALQPNYIANGVGDMDDVTIRQLNAENVPGISAAGDEQPPNLFELRFDHTRKISVLQNTYAQTDLGGQIRQERIASVVADVAGAAYLSNSRAGSENRRPDNFRQYTVRPQNMPGRQDATQFYPVIPFQSLSVADDRYMVRGTKSPTGNWENNLVTIDGIYMSAHTAFDRKTHIIPQYFPTYRATFVEPTNAISALNTVTGETSWAQYRRRLGVFHSARGINTNNGYHDWPNYPNIHATKGAIGFWYKPDFNWENEQSQGTFSQTRRYCGFFSATALASPSVRAPRPAADPISAGATARAQKPPSGPNQAQVLSASQELNSYSYRGTQMNFMRMPSGELRLVRLYFEMIGVPNLEPYQTYSGYYRDMVRTGTYTGNMRLQGSAFHFQPMFMNPYYKYPQGSWHKEAFIDQKMPLVPNDIPVSGSAYAPGSIRDKLVNTPYLNLRYYVFLHEYHNIVLSEEVTRGQLNGNLFPMPYNFPPVYPYPPLEMYLPRNSGELSGLGATRQVIDAHLNTNTIKTGRYEVIANPRLAGNRQKMNLKRNRWYHIAVTWDDSSATRTVKSPGVGGNIYIDGVQLGTETYVRNDTGGLSYDGYDWGVQSQRDQLVHDFSAFGTASYTNITATPSGQPRTTSLPKFVNLNQSLDVYLPNMTPLTDSLNTLGHAQDELVVGGIFRRQHPNGVIPGTTKPAGVFKHRRAGDLICIPCNGTIDDFCVTRFRDPTTGGAAVATRAPEIIPQEIRNRYFEDGGMWTNWVPEFDGLAASGSAPQIVSVRFTAYVPYNLNGATGSTQKLVAPLQNASVRVRLFVADPRQGTSNRTGGTQLREVSGILGEKFWPTRSAGSGGDATGISDPPVIDLSSSPIVVAKDKRLLYQVIMTPGFDRPVNGDATDAGFGLRAVGTPVFDSITFVYKLSGNQVIVREQVFD